MNTFNKDELEYLLEAMKVYSHKVLCSGGGRNYYAEDTHFALECKIKRILEDVPKQQEFDF